MMGNSFKDKILFKKIRERFFERLEQENKTPSRSKAVDFILTILFLQSHRESDFFIFLYAWISIFLLYGDFWGALMQAQTWSLQGRLYVLSLGRWISLAQLESRTHNWSNQLWAVFGGAVMWPDTHWQGLWEERRDWQTKQID